MMELKQAPELQGKSKAKRCPESSTCRYCKLIDTSGTIKSKFDGRKFHTRQNVCCKSYNQIYAKVCKPSGSQYVGETKRNWRDRLSNHFNNITKELMVVPVGHHFSQCNGHSGLNDIKLYVLEFCQTPPDDKHRQTRNKLRGSGNSDFTAITPSE